MKNCILINGERFLPVCRYDFRGREYVGIFEYAQEIRDGKPVYRPVPKVFDPASGTLKNVLTAEELLEFAKRLENSVKEIMESGDYGFRE